MTIDNLVQLAGSLHDAPWTSYGRAAQGCVNFWLAVSREQAGDGFDLVRCCVEHKTADEIGRLMAELKAGRTVRVSAAVRSQVRSDASLLAQAPAVVFVVSELGLDGQAPRNAHNVGRPPRHHGKAAAANDGDLLQLEEMRG